VAIPSPIPHIPRKPAGRPRSPDPQSGWQVNGSPRSLRKSGGFLFRLPFILRECPEQSLDRCSLQGKANAKGLGGPLSATQPTGRTHQAPDISPSPPISDISPCPYFCCSKWMAVYFKTTAESSALSGSAHAYFRFGSRYGGFPRPPNE
jgi:hypothetical protein